MNREVLNNLLVDVETHRAVVLVTNLESGEQQVLHPLTGHSDAEGTLVAAARDALRKDACETLDYDGQSLFLQPLNPPLRMIIIGAVHIAQPLATMAAVANWDVVVVDPRQAWATGDRFPGVRLLTDWPDVAVRALAPDARTAVVTLTHDPKLDDPALSIALRSPAFYVGCLGSRKTHEARLGRLSTEGMSREELDRIHAPIGLPIGARSPAEIAIAIMAQITQVLRGGD